VLYKLSANVEFCIFTFVSINLYLLYSSTVFLNKNCFVSKYEKKYFKRIFGWRTSKKKRKYKILKFHTRKFAEYLYFQQFDGKIVTFLVLFIIFQSLSGIPNLCDLVIFHASFCIFCMLVFMEEFIVSWEIQRLNYEKDFHYKICVVCYGKLSYFQNVWYEVTVMVLTFWIINTFF